MIIQQRALAAIGQHALLTQAIAVEPALKDTLLELAAYEKIDDHWQAYEHYKQQCARYVGFAARTSALQAGAYYDATLGLIEQLLCWIEQRAAESEAGDE
jgi:hypothetical protein